MEMAASAKTMCRLVRTPEVRRWCSRRRVAQSRKLVSAVRGSWAVERTLAARIEAGLMRRNPGYGHPLRPEYRLTAPGSQGRRGVHRPGHPSRPARNRRYRPEEMVATRRPSAGERRRPIQPAAGGTRRRHPARAGSDAQRSAAHRFDRAPPDRRLSPSNRI